MDSKFTPARTKNVKLTDMQRHVAELCDRHDIWHRTSRNRNAFALREVSEINTPPIRGAVSYAVALHEIGHILVRHQQSRHVLTRENWAWRWARKNALFWTSRMERYAVNCLDWYRARAKSIDPKWQPTVWVGARYQMSDQVDHDTRESDVITLAVL